MQYGYLAVWGSLLLWIEIHVRKKYVPSCPSRRCCRFSNTYFFSSSSCTINIDTTTKLLHYCSCQQILEDLEQQPISPGMRMRDYWITSSLNRLTLNVSNQACIILMTLKYQHKGKKGSIAYIFATKGKIPWFMLHHIGCYTITNGILTGSFLLTK